MTDRELRKLNRTELLQILVDLSQENEALQQQKSELEQRLEDKRIDLEDLGSIAEASLKLSGIFQAAQEAVDIYLENVKRIHGVQKRADRIIAETKQRCADIEAACQRRCDEYIKNAKREAHESLGGELINLYDTTD